MRSATSVEIHTEPEPKLGFYERTVYWLEEKQKKIKKQRKMMKQNEEVLNFEPNVRQSQRSINKTILAPAKKPITNIKGVNQHMKRIMEAQKKKIEDASFFLLPSQKA